MSHPQTIHGNLGSFTQFWRYSVANFISFLVDITVVWLLTHFFALYYLISICIGFFIATLLNYIFDRKVVFKNTTVKFMRSYTISLLVASSTLILIFIITFFLVEYLHVNYLIARTIAAFVGGMWSYILDGTFTFRVLLIPYAAVPAVATPGSNSIGTMSDPKVYISPIETIGKHTVWLVDGEYIRKEINENFVEYDEHYHLPFIPKQEFWIDKNTDPAEHHFFIDHMINEQWLIQSGKTYDEAMAIANVVEKKERAKFQHIDHEVIIGGTKKEIAKDISEKVHKKLLTEYSTAQIQVWLIDGEIVRNNFLVEYADGGHDLVYSFIPAHEIWLEEGLSDHELKFILVHELHERFLMGQGKDYKHAHRGATEVEDYYRDHPAEIESRLHVELTKNTEPSMS